MDGQMNPDQAKQFVMQTVQESGIPPEIYVRLGQMAEQVLKDKKVYPDFVSEMIRNGIADESDFGQKMDYQSLIAMIAMGRVCSGMSQPAGAA